jgi:hypothetical protein
MTAPTGTIRYTLDGSDPRKQTNAPAYGASITLTNSVIVKARAFSSNTWSALNEAAFFVGKPTLAITEIHYHPTDPTAVEQAAGFSNSDDFEFIELQNFGRETIHLTGARFTNGIQFSFSSSTVSNLLPGQIILLAKNRTAFDLRYGNGLPVAGEYAGNLSNGGETVTLVDSNDAVLVSVAYDDVSPWPAAADGAGSSLELLDTSGDFNSSTNWQASAQSGGTPGSSSLILRIESAQVDGVLFKMRFRARAGRAYSVLYRASASSGPWNLLRVTDPPLADTLIEVTDSLPSGAGGRFYRLSIP